MFLWQLPDRPDSLRILRPKEDGSEIVRPKRQEMAMHVVELVFEALRYESPDFKAPVIPGSRYEAYIKQFVNPVSDNASQTEEDDSQAAGSDSLPNIGPENIQPETTVREKMIEEISAKKQKAGQLARQTEGQAAGQGEGQGEGHAQRQAPSSVPTSFGPGCQTSPQPPSKSAPSPPPPDIETSPATLPHRNPPRAKAVTPVPSPMRVIPETGQDGQEEPARQEPRQDQQDQPDQQGGWQARSNRPTDWQQQPQQSDSWRNWNHWGWGKPW